MKTTEITLKAEMVYNLINKFNSQGITPLIDKIFPEHDGKANHAEAADIAELLLSLNRLGKACETGVKHLNEVIETYEREWKH